MTAVTDDRLLWGLRSVLYAVGEPEPDWQAIEQAWLEACQAASGTEYEGAVRTSGVLLRLRDGDRLAAEVRHLLGRLKRSGD